MRPRACSGAPTLPDSPFAVSSLRERQVGLLQGVPEWPRSFGLYPSRVRLPRFASRTFSLNDVFRLYESYKEKKTNMKETTAMETIDQQVEVNADIRTVYNQWTQFEDFPEFMEGIDKVHQVDDKRLHWVAKVGGREYEWDAEIYQQAPDQVIAWRSISGRRNDGMVRFEKLADEKTRVHVQFVYEPEGALEKTADALGVLSARVKGDLKRFKEFIENRGRATGGWRGEIHQGEVRETGGSAAGKTRSQRLHGDPTVTRKGSV